MRKVLLLCSFLIACSCANQGSDAVVKTLEFDVDNYIIINLTECPHVCLDEDITIGMVKNMQILDSSLLIHSSAGLYLFSLRTGELEKTYSRKGRGPEEYISLWSYNIADTIVQMYDMNRKRLLEYSIEGEFIRFIDMPQTYSDNPFQTFIQIGDKYLGKRVFGGESDIPELAMYDKDFRYLRDVLPELRLRSGLMLHNPFALNSDGNVLYCSYFGNIIYEITPDAAKPAFRVDFNRNSFDSGDDFKDEYDIIDHINSSHKKYAVNFSNIQEDNHFLSFNYLYDSTKRLALYDKKESRTYSVVLASGTERADQIYRAGDYTYVLTQSEEGATKLYKFETVQE